MKCLPTKELYRDYISGYRVLSFTPIGKYPDLQLNKYHNFSISGTNLNNVKIGQECNFDIQPDTKSKYPASYVLVGYNGVSIEDTKITVKPEHEFEILTRLMTEGQANNILKAYPDFIQMVLNGEQDKIDVKNIYNVGEYRLNEYIKKVKDDCHTILFYPVCFEYGITNYDIIKSLQAHYDSPNELKQALDTTPYHVYIDVANIPFNKADQFVIEKNPEFIDGVERCTYGCLEILKENEEEGDTRLNANILAKYAKQLIPEAAEHIVDVVTNSPLIHYDKETKYASLEQTYQYERLIADNILSRLKDSNPSYEAKGYTIEKPMNWQDYLEVDGFQCTDEQAQILQYVAEGKRVAILTGSGGSGKSSSLKALIRMLEGNMRTYTLLAPTGIAAKKMRESTGRQAMTIHMFNLRQDVEAGEYVIIDETSMVGVELMGKLFNKIGKNPNVIFVCDEAQLASISCGNIVQNILTSGVIPRANLTKIFRYGTQGIATAATDVRFGKFDMQGKQFDDFALLPIESDPVQQVLDQYEEFIKQGYTKNDIIVLSPFNKGKYGTYAINQAIQQSFNDKPFTEACYERKQLGKIKFKIGDKVLSTHNNYNMPCVAFDEEGNEIDDDSTIPVMNGDIGYVRECRASDNGPVLIVEFDTGLAKISGKDIAELLLGYAISIHKIQGAQAKAVIVVLDKMHKKMLSRNLLYVAFSRAQKVMTVIADEDVIKDGLERQENMERDTYLCDMLKEGMNNT